jgi:hypothetical protein
MEEGGFHDPDCQYEEWSNSESQLLEYFKYILFRSFFMLNYSAALSKWNWHYLINDKSV